MRIVLADNQQERREQVRRVLLGEGLTCEADDAVGFEALPARLAGVKADLVLVVTNGAREAAMEAIRTAHSVANAPILVTGEKATVELVREAMRAGAREFLDAARFREELSEALIKIEAEGNVPNERGTLISIFSPNGGVGVTTTALNLAARLAGGQADQVALVDLKPTPSDLALMLDLKPQHTVNDVCRSWERLDRRMLDGAMTRHSSGIHVLAQAGYPEDGSLPASTLSRDAVRQLCCLTRRMYRFVVLDLAHTLDEDQIEAMRLSNLVGLIVRPDVPGLRRARWALDAAAALDVQRDRFRLVLNRFGQRGQVDVAKVEEILGIKVFQRIPEDHRAVNKAVNRGVPVSELSKLSRISRSFSSFARSVQTSS